MMHFMSPVEAFSACWHSLTRCSRRRQKTQNAAVHDAITTSSRIVADETQQKISIGEQHDATPQPQTPITKPALDLLNGNDAFSSADVSPSFPPAAKLEATRSLQDRRVSSIKPGTIGDDSLISEDAPSDFSRLARNNVSRPSPARSIEGVERAQRPRTLGEMSIAKLTSGVADGGWRSR